MDVNIYNNTVYGNAFNSSGTLNTKTEISLGASSWGEVGNILTKHNVDYSTQANTYATWVGVNTYNSSGLSITNYELKVYSAWSILIALTPTPIILIRTGINLYHLENRTGMPDRIWIIGTPYAWYNPGTPEKFIELGNKFRQNARAVVLGGAPIKIWVISGIETPPQKVEGYLRIQSIYCRKVDGHT